MDATSLVSAWNALVVQLAYVFTEPTARVWRQIALGWVLHRGPATVTGIYQTLGDLADRHWTVYEKFFYRAAWSLNDLSLRLLMHVPDWRRSMAEWCRVADQTLVFDYPALGSPASLQAAWRQVARKAGQNVEAYRTFSNGAIARELHRHGFRIIATHKQFVIPIAVHKLIGSAGFTRGVERALAGIGILGLAGSPVTIAAERCAS